MISKPIDDLIESYSDQLQKMLPMNVAALTIVACTLFWSIEAGEYKSVVLSALNSSIPQIMDSQKGLIIIPVYAIAGIATATFACSRMLDILFIKFLGYLANLPKIRENISGILKTGKNENEDLQPATMNTLVSRAESNQKKFQELTSFARITVLVGIICAATSLPGNKLDLALGLALVVSGVLSYHFSAKIFIGEFLPIRAKIRHHANEKK